MIAKIRSLVEILNFGCMKEQPLFFPTPADFRQWLDKNHTSEDVVWVGYYKVGAVRPSVTWPESVDQALCYGWIDGIRKKQDEESYKVRFIPRRKGSHWSEVNIKKVTELIKDGLMTPIGLVEFNKRTKKESKLVLIEQRKIQMPTHFVEIFMENKKAWKNFQDLPSGYRNQCTRYVIEAKQEKTKLRRLNILIENAERGEKIPPLRSSRE